MDQMNENIRILMLEDVPSDAELEEIELQDAGQAFTSLRWTRARRLSRRSMNQTPTSSLADYRLQPITP